MHIVVACPKNTNDTKLDVAAMFLEEGISFQSSLQFCIMSHLGIKTSNGMR